MPKATIMKVPVSSLPVNDRCYIFNERAKYFEDMPDYGTKEVEYKNERHAKFHSKWFCLVKFGFDNWDHPEEYKGAKIQPHFEAFRKEITIFSGWYDVVASLTNFEVKKVAKSISFAKMNDEEFKELYENTKTVIWERIFLIKNTYTQRDFEEAVLKLSDF